MKYAFEEFKSVEEVLAGQPFKIFPVGTFYRGDRVLSITDERLIQMEANFKNSLPRFRVPINENHSGIGKVGTILDVEHRAGDGLYATKYEFTDTGKKLLEDKRYDAVSGEVFWTLNEGSKYQDPNTGEYFDNVLCGMALTDTPYFGHDEVALFSATKPTLKGNEMEKEEFDAKMKAQSDDFAAKLAEQEKTLKAQKDAFDAQLKTQQEQFDAEKKRADEFAQKLAAEQKTRKLVDLTREATDVFTHISIAPDEFATNMYTLETVAPELATWVRDQFTAIETQMAQSSLFTQFSKTHSKEQGVETLETLAAKILAEEFKGDKSKTTDAYVEASKRRPDFIPADLKDRNPRK